MECQIKEVGQGNNYYRSFLDLGNKWCYGLELGLYTEDSRDARALYFLLRIVDFILHYGLITHDSQWSIRDIIFLTTTQITASLKPYQKHI